MADEHANGTPNATRLLSYYFAAPSGGLSSAAIMLCEVIGNEIQSISLRGAADPMIHKEKRDEA